MRHFTMTLGVFLLIVGGTVGDATVPGIAAAATPLSKSSDNRKPSNIDTLNVNFLSGRNFSVAGLAPGDYTEWGAEVTNTGVTSGSLIIRLSSPSGFLAAPDAIDGLQLSVEGCTQRLLVTTAAAGVQSFGCPVAATTMAAPTTNSTAQATLFSVPLDAGKTIGFRARADLASTAGNSLQGVTHTISVDFEMSNSPDHAALPAAGASDALSRLADPPVTAADILATVLAAAITFLGGLGFLFLAHSHSGIAQLVRSSMLRLSPRGAHP